MASIISEIDKQSTLYIQRGINTAEEVSMHLDMCGPPPLGLNPHLGVVTRNTDTMTSHGI